MMSMRLVVLLPLLLGMPAAGLAADLLVSDRMHHLRSGGEREWAEFPEQAGGSELVLAFDATRNEGEHTLRLRHRDLKQIWRMLLNGQEIARLPPDEADTITYWAVPPRLLADGRNELRVHCAGSGGDDVMIGQVTLIDRPVQRVLSEATVDILVRQQPGGRATPSRITVVDQQGTLISLGNASGAQHAVRPGVVYSGTGAVRLKLPAGRYVIYAGRGFEYSVARTDVDLAPGANLSRRLSIRREVDTAGWAAMDTHVHTGTFARHGDAGIDERMLTIAGEGIELPVSAEHNTLVDFDGHARRARVRPHFTPVLGSEVTTPSLGHFNVFPIRRRSPGRRPARAGLAPAPRCHRECGHRPGDRAEPRPGRPRRFSTARFRAAHRHRGGGPRRLAAARQRDGGRQFGSGDDRRPGAAGRLDGPAQPGAFLTPVGSSDSHDVTRYIVGQGRTYVRCDDRSPGRIDLHGGCGEPPARPDDGQLRIAHGTGCRGEGPGRAGRAEGRARRPDPCEGTRLDDGGARCAVRQWEQVREEAIADGKKAGMKWQATWRLPRPPHDVHLVAIATGPGVAAPYWPSAKPYQPVSIDFTSYVLGVSGAAFVDGDGSGDSTAPSSTPSGQSLPQKI